MIVTVEVLGKNISGKIQVHKNIFNKFGIVAAKVHKNILNKCRIVAVNVEKYSTKDESCKSP